MRNYVHKGGRFVFTAPADVESGEIVILNQAVGVSEGKVLNGAEGVMVCDEVFSFPKAAGAIAFGAKVYYDGAAKNVTTTVGSNTPIGFAAKPAIAGAATVEVRLQHRT